MQNSFIKSKTLSLFFPFFLSSLLWTLTSCHGDLKKKQFVTKEWLEKILSRKIESFEISNGAKPGAGVAGATFSVNVTFFPENSTWPWSLESDPYCMDGIVKSDPETDPLKQKTGSRTHLLFLKTIPTDPVQKARLVLKNLLWKEVKNYETILPQLRQLACQLEDKNKNKGTITTTSIVENDSNQSQSEVPFPPLIYGTAVDYSKFKDLDPKTALTAAINPLENCLVLPDLTKESGFKMLDSNLPIDLDHYKLVFKAQARLHAFSWAYKQKAGIKILGIKFPFLTDKKWEGQNIFYLQEMAEDFQIFRDAIESISPNDDLFNIKNQLLKGLNRTQELLPHIFTLYYSDTTDSQLDSPNMNKGNILRIPQPTISHEEPWLVFTHGDSWMNNWMFHYNQGEDKKPDQVMFVDLQSSKEGDLLTDLVYAWYTATTREFRKSNLNLLLEEYHQTFISTCKNLQLNPPKDFKIEEVQRRFHRATIFGLIVAVRGLPLSLRDRNGNDSSNQMCGGSHQSKNIQPGSLQIRADGRCDPFRRRALDILRDLYEDGII